MIQAETYFVLNNYTIPYNWDRQLVVHVIFFSPRYYFKCNVLINRI